MNWELADVQARFREGAGARDWIANIPWISPLVFTSNEEKRECISKISHPCPPKMFVILMKVLKIEHA